jgi:hypothetical protein
VEELQLVETKQVQNEERKNVVRECEICPSSNIRGFPFAEYRRTESETIQSKSLDHLKEKCLVKKT